MACGSFHICTACVCDSAPLLALPPHPPHPTLTFLPLTPKDPVIHEAHQIISHPKIFLFSLKMLFIYS